MLHIILTILKILGILLLCILALLVTVLLLVLFVPARYQIRAKKQDTIEASLRVTWLWHMASVRFYYDGEQPGSVIRILGIPLPTGREKKKLREKEPSKTQRKKRPPADEALESNVSKKKEPLFGRIRKNAGKKAGPGKPPEIYAGKSNEDGAQEKEIHSGCFMKVLDKLFWLYRKLNDFFQELVRRIKKIRYTFAEICDKIKNAKENADYYVSVLSQERHKNALRFVKSQAGRLLKHMLPQKIKGVLLIGMEDPAQLGQILAVLGMFYPLYGKNIRITPEFGQTIFQGELFIKGRIMAFVILRTALRIYFHKDFQHLIRAMKKEVA